MKEKEKQSKKQEEKSQRPLLGFYFPLSAGAHIHSLLPSFFFKENEKTTTAHFFFVPSVINNSGLLNNRERERVNCVDGEIFVIAGSAAAAAFAAMLLFVNCIIHRFHFNAKKGVLKQNSATDWFLFDFRHETS